MRLRFVFREWEEVAIVELVTDSLSKALLGRRDVLSRGATRYVEATRRTKVL